MDINFLTKEYKYPRIFMYAANFETNDKMWEKINSLQYLNNKFYKIANIIIKKYLSDGNYDALHWRYNGFNERKEYLTKISFSFCWRFHVEFFSR